ncbi:unnamed protein product [Oppiella nova]|uniref:Uncharacterized protein n=1 Tax=Oppiella nova TaxID=334625 RepID=A0A7R9R099_9ACAR|nr:unnamed protein product [Oppiella nova]CAG2182115.1 unnamed protein product [Oppiella nova]
MRTSSSTTASTIRSIGWAIVTRPSPTTSTNTSPLSPISLMNPKIWSTTTTRYT